LSLLRRILFYLLIAASIGAAVWGYFHLKQSKKPGLKAEEVLPANAVCVFSSSDFSELANKLRHQNLIWNELVNIEDFRHVNNYIRFYDSLIMESENLRSFFRDEKILLAFYRKESTIHYMITFNLKDLTQAKDFSNEIGAVLKSAKKTEAGYELNILGAKQILKLDRGVIVISDNEELVKSAFMENESKLFGNVMFARLKKIDHGDELLDIYIDHKQLRSTVAQTKLNTSDIILSGHSSSNLEINPDELSLNGFNAPDSLSLLNALVSQKSQPSDFFQMLPFNTIGFSAIGFHDFNLLRNHLKPEKNEFWKSVNDSAMFNAEGEFYGNIQSKLIEIDLKHNSIISKAVLIEVKDTAKASELLPYLCDTVHWVQSVKLGVLDSLKENLITTSFGELFKCWARYSFVYGNYLVLCEKKEVAEYYINSLLNNSSVMQNESFASYARENLDISFNYLHYSSPAKEMERVTNILQFVKPESQKYLEKLSDLSINISNYKDLLQFRLNVKYQQNHQGKETPGLWMLEMDTLLVGKPFAFVNHKTSESEIIVTDAKNNIHLVNATGNLLWTKQVEEPILSDIYTVDAFKNNKLQMLFNTANYIHMFDRNGKEVEGFPVKLLAEASAPLTVLDYEGTKDYRLFIACKDKKIYNYAITGQKNEKFNVVRTDAEVKLPVLYAKVGLSDYLLTADEGGKIYVFSRKGDGRIDLRNKILEDCRNLHISPSNNLQNTKLLYLDDKNSLLSIISLADKKDIVKLGKEFEEPKLIFDLVDDDKKTDLILMDRTKLSCYDLSGNELFAYESNGVEFTDVTYFFDTDGAYFILNTASNEIHVVAASTKASAKKLKATTQPMISDLFKDGKKYILVADGRTLKCVLLK
jgi:hypothetical protein